MRHRDTSGDVVFRRPGAWTTAAVREDGRLRLEIVGGADALHDPRRFTVPLTEPHLAALREDLGRHLLPCGKLMPLRDAAGTGGPLDEAAAPAPLDSILLGGPEEVDALCAHGADATGRARRGLRRLRPARSMVRGRRRVRARPQAPERGRRPVLTASRACARIARRSGAEAAGGTRGPRGKGGAASWPAATSWDAASTSDPPERPPVAEGRVGGGAFPS